MNFIILLSMLIVAVLNDPLKTIYNTISIPQGSRIYRVIKLQEITFTHSLTHTPNGWLEYPGLTTVLKVPFDQFVPIYYTIVINSANICWMNTRLMIDNKQVKLMAASSHNVVLHDHKGFAEMLLTKGDHSIRIDYRTDCNYNNIIINEWNAISVRADYLQVQAQKS